MATFDLTTPEQWFSVPDHDGYEISSRFRVRSWRVCHRASEPGESHPLALFVSKKGYLVFHARRQSRRVTLYVHHVVAALTLGPRPEGQMVLHDDDDKLNNDPANLYYGTVLQNARDSKRNGRHPQGEGRSDARLTANQAREIYRRAWAGENQRLLGAEFGVSQSTVDRIKRKLMWAHVHEGTD